MTILASLLLGPDRAIVMTNSETWQRGSVSGCESKMAVNPMLSAAGAGRGPGDVVTAANAALLAAADFDKAVSGTIPQAMRVATLKHGPALDKEPEPFCAEYVACGWSHSAGRIMQWHFSFSHFYAAIINTRIMSPAVPMPSEVWCPLRAAELVPIARAQMAGMRRLDAKAGARGALVIADVTRCSVAISTIHDFDADIATRLEMAA